MNIHKNASMTPRGRAHLMREIDLIGLKPAAAAACLSEGMGRGWGHCGCDGRRIGCFQAKRHEARFARPFVIGRRNWLFADTVAGANASANLYSLLQTCKRGRHHMPRCAVRTGLIDRLQRAVALRRNQRLTYECIAERVGLPRSTVARTCKAAGVARLPALWDAVPVLRYERQTAGELLHLDAKKLGRFDKPGASIARVAALDVPRQLLSVTLCYFSSPSDHSPWLQREQRVEKLHLARWRLDSPRGGRIRALGSAVGGLFERSFPEIRWRQ